MKSGILCDIRLIEIGFRDTVYYNATLTWNVKDDLVDFIIKVIIPV